MSRRKTALITGFTGQDGTFLAELLLNKGYTVIGLTRRISTEPPRRIRGHFDFNQAIKTGQLVLEQGDLLSVDSLLRILRKHSPDEIYNLAAQSHVGTSFKQPEFTIDADLMGVVNLITAISSTYFTGNPRIYQASTSEMFGDRKDTDLNEETSLKPNSPYAIAKTAAHQYCQMKRAQGMFISCGILFNHESEIRGGDFVTQKIARGAVNWMKTGEPIALGNLNASRDWGYAGDYVQAMYMMLQSNTPDDYVVATGESHTIKEFCDAAFKALGFDIDWIMQGAGEFVKGLVNGHDAIVIDPQFYRPNDVGYLHGDPRKIEQNLGWKPQVTFDELVALMVESAK